MSDSRLAHEFGTFSSHVDDLHIGGILPVVYSRDCPATWSASIHSVRKRSRFYGTLLEEIPKGHGGTINHEYSLPPIDRRSVREDHTGVRGHATSMCPGS